MKFIPSSINLDAQVDTQTINDWATGRDEFEYDLSDREIVQSVLENDYIQENGSDSDCSIVEVENKISSSEAKSIFPMRFSGQNKLTLRLWTF